MNTIANLARSKGDPKILKSGASSMGAADRLARWLGWFSIGLGAMQIAAPQTLTRMLGMRGMEPYVRACGAREIASGVVTLSPDKRIGLWSRVAGDVLDIAALVPALHPANPRRNNVKLALAMVVGVTALDIFGVQALRIRHGQGTGQRRRFDGRSGFPKGIEAARGAAKGVRMNGSRHPAGEVARQAEPVGSGGA